MPRRIWPALVLAVLGLRAGAAFGQVAAPVEVLVKGDTLGRRASRDATVDSSVLSRRDLSYPGTSTAQALATVPGVQIRQSGGTLEPAQLSLRGGNSAQVNVYLDELRLNDELTGAADVSFFSPLILERIEIYRGHAPRFSEQLGLSGAIVLIPRIPKSTRVVSQLGLGSYGNNEQLLGASAASSVVGSLVFLHRAQQDNNYSYRDNRGTVQDTSDDRDVTRRNADARSIEVYASGYYRPTANHRLRWYALTVDREQGVTGLGLVPAQMARAHYTRQLLALSASVPCSKKARAADSCRISLTTEYGAGREHLSDPAYELGYGAKDVDNETRNLTHRLQLTSRLTDTLSVGWIWSEKSASLSVLQDQNQGLAARRLTAIPGLDVNFNATQFLTLTAIARGQVERTNGIGTSTTGSPLATGRVGAAVNLGDDWVLSGNLGHYYRSPTLAELYGTGPFLRGNSELRPESGNGYDVELSYRTTGKYFRLLTSLSAFLQQLDGLVAWQRSTFGQLRPYNVGSAQLRGSDVQVSLDLGEVTRLRTTLSFLDPRDNSADRALPNAILPYRSRFVQNSNLAFYLPSSARGNWLREVSTWLNYQHRSSRYAVRAGNSVLPATRSLDVGASLGLTQVPLTLRGQIMNLLATQNYDLVGFPLPRRGFAVSLEMDLVVAP